MSTVGVFDIIELAVIMSIVGLDDVMLVVLGDEVMGGVAEITTVLFGVLSAGGLLLVEVYSFV